MSPIWTLLFVVALAAIGYGAGRARAMRSASGDIRNLHSLPSYYGANAMLSVLVPALALMVIWLIVQPMFIETRVQQHIPPQSYADSGALSLIMSDAVSYTHLTLPTICSV